MESDRWATGLPLGRFQMEAEIGRGSTVGHVYRARDPLTGRVVAIKTIRLELLPERMAALYRLRLQVEAQAAGGLSHPNVVRIFDQGEDYIVMEHLEGTLLSDLLPGRPFRLDDALGILADVGAALDHAHSRGIVHRDIKPANVMVLHEGSSKLLDFGLARLPGGERSVGENFLFTPSYMAPEQILDGCASPLSDLFSLAVVGYELLTGRKPFPGDNVGRITYAVVYEDPLPLSSATHLPPVYQEIFGRMLAKEPDRRLPSAAAFVGALQAHRQAPHPQAPPRPAHPRPTPARASSPPTAVPRPAFDDLERVPEDVLPTSDPRIEETQELSQRWAASGDGAVARADLPRLHIASDPVGAAVWVDGVRMGRTPLELPLTAGLHRLRFIEEGFAPVQLVMSVPEAGSSSHVQVTLQPLVFARHPPRVADRRDAAIQSALGLGALDSARARRPD